MRRICAPRGAPHRGARRCARTRRGPGRRARRRAIARRRVISDDPAADNTDVYAFVSPDRPDTVTIVANYIPLEEPAGGPNFDEFGDDVLYELKVDNTGDGSEDVTLPVRVRDADSERATRSSTTPARSTRSRTRTGTVLRRTSVTRVDDAERTTMLLRDLPTPPGQHRAALDPELRLAHGGRGPAAARRDQGLRGPDRRPVLRRPRLGLRPRRPAAVQPRARHSASGGGRGRRRRRLQHARDRAPGPDHAAHARRQAARGRRPEGRDRRLRDGEPAADADHRPNGRRRVDGDWVQVSRLAEPADQRGRDPARRRRTAGTRPTRRTTRTSRRTTRARGDCASRICSTRCSTTRPRRVAATSPPILLTGVPRLNFTGPTQADLIRLNTGIAPTVPGGHGQPARRPRRRLRRLPERPAARGRRHRHRAPRPRVRLRRRSSGRSSRASASAPATATARRTTCSATASTRTTGPSA